MNKNYVFIFLFAFALIPFLTIGQNLVVNGDLEQWDDANTPTGWDLTENISQEATEVHGGSYSAAHMSATSSQKFRQDIQGIVGGQQYTIRYYFLDNVDNAKTRIWSYWVDSEGDYLDDNKDELRPDEYSENSADWQEFEVVLTAPSAAAQFRFEVRVYHQDNNVDGYVYYDDFFMEGTSTNYPEPTNYPTDFTATADGLSVMLNWTDAAGAQLPGAYLIYGLQGASGPVPVPVDGTPVADDMDWSDGEVAVNVPFGEEMFHFSGLTGGETYRFVIYPYTNAGANINFKTDGDAPLATAELSSLIIINEEDFEDGTLGTWMQVSVEGPQEWEHYEHQGDNFARMSGYDGGAVVNEDWLISPVMDLSPYQNVIFNFISARNYDGPDVQLYLSQDYDGSGNPNDFTWLEITSEADWSEGSWEWIESGDVDLSLYVYETFYLGFKYTSTNAEAAAWEIDDILVYSEGGVGIPEKEVPEIAVFPNPARDLVTISNPGSGEIRLMNINGQVILSKDVKGGENQLDLEQLRPGLYFVQFSDKEQNVTTRKLMVR